MCHRLQKSAKLKKGGHYVKVSVINPTLRALVPLQKSGHVIKASVNSTSTYLTHGWVLVVWEYHLVGRAQREAREDAAEPAAAAALALRPVLLALRLALGRRLRGVRLAVRLWGTLVC